MTKEKDGNSRLPRKDNRHNWQTDMFCLPPFLFLSEDTGFGDATCVVSSETSFSQKSYLCELNFYSRCNILAHEQCWESSRRQDELLQQKPLAYHPCLVWMRTKMWKRCCRLFPSDSRSILPEALGRVLHP